jgi:lysophospholipase L1-like esterase
MNTSWIKRHALRWVPLLIVVVLLEGFSYVAWHAYLKDKRSNGVFRVKQILAGGDLVGNQTIVSNPYSLYWNNPEFADDHGRQYDSHGYRSPEYVPRDGELRVLVLGGSTTNEYPYIPDPKKTWTYLLNQTLEKATGRPVHVFNAGIPNGTTAELLSHFVFRGKYLKPHIVVLHEGGNDVAALLYPGYQTDYSHLRRSTGAAVGRPFERALLTVSHFARLGYSVWLRGEGVYQASPYDVSLVDRSKAVSMIEANPSPAFRNNVDSLVTEATHAGARVLLVSFIQAKEENLSRNRPDIVGLEHAITLGVDKHNAIMKEVAGKQGQSFLPLQRERFQDSWFLDNCHLNESGAEEKARQVAQAILRML